MIITREKITDFIPHRFPFILIDNLVRVSREQFESDFLIEANTIFVENGLFQEAGLIENIAQTCAASFGYLDREEAGTGQPKIGYIGAVSRLELYELPAVNSVICSVVSPTHQLGNIILVTGKSYCDGRLLMQCEMKIVMSE